MDKITYTSKDKNTYTPFERNNMVVLMHVLMMRRHPWPVLSCLDCEDDAHVQFYLERLEAHYDL